jgi:hypothetical protein
MTDREARIRTVLEEDVPTEWLLEEVARRCGAGTDQQRATAFICTHLGFDPMESTEDIAVLEDEFNRVRLDERRAIAAWLRGLYATRRGDPRELADLIERGRHGS